MSDAELKSAICILRSLANSQKNTSINDLARDYAQTEGGVVPFKKFGYPSLESFLVGSGEFFVTPWKTVEAKCNAESAHISKLVAEQNAKKKSKKFVRPQRNIYPVTFHRPTIGYQTTGYQQNNRSGNLSHVNRYPSKYVNPGYQPYVARKALPTITINPQIEPNEAKKPAAFSIAAPAKPVLLGFGSQRDYSKPQNGTKPMVPKPRDDKPSFVFTFEKPVQNLNEVKEAESAPTKPVPSVIGYHNPAKNTIPRTVDKKVSFKNDDSVRKVTKSPENPMLVIRVPIITGKSDERIFEPEPEITLDSMSDTTRLRGENPKKSALVDLRQVLNRKLEAAKENSAYMSGQQPVAQVLSNQIPDRPIIVVSAPNASKNASRSVPASPPAKLAPPKLTPINNPHLPSPVVATPEKTPPRLTPRVSPRNIPKMSLVHHRLNVTSNLDKLSTPSGSSQSLSSCTAEVAVTRNPPVAEANPDCPPDAIAKLAQFANAQGWQEPDYNFVRLPSSRIQGRVMLNGTSISTGFLDFDTTHEAGLFTARKALEHFNRISESADNPELVNMLHEWLSSHPHGVFIKHIPDEFKKSKQIDLPEDWLSLVAQHLERFFVVTAASGEDKILYAEQPKDELDVDGESADLLPAMEALSLEPTEDEVVADAEVMSACLNLPWSERCWNINITNAVSTKEVWGRLIGPEHSAELDDLMVDIEMDIMVEKHHPTSLIVGEIYLAVAEFTFRVRIERNDFTLSQCLCFSIDNGLTEWYPMDQIFVCRPEFLKFPGQAFCLSLFGLEDCADHPHASSCLQSTLNDQSLVAAIISKKFEYYMQVLTNPDATPRLTAILYDTSTSEDVQLNDIILDEICSETEWLSFNELGLTTATISHVAETGEIFCQPHSNADDLNYVLALIQKTIERPSLFKHRFTPEDSPNRLFLVKDPLDQQYYRATLGAHRGNLCEVFYVDVGCDQVVETNDILRLSSLCTILQKYPHQAIGCHLFEVDDITPVMVERLRRYLKVGSTAMMKLMTIDENRQRYVKIFMRYQNGPLLNVNYSIQLEDEIKRYTTPEPTDEKPVLVRSTSPSVVPLPISSMNTLRPLEKCETPDIGQFFKVHITLSCNPHDFRVRAHHHIRALEDLMMQIQEYTKFTTDFVDKLEIRVGQAYLCQQSDDIWYRVVVQKSFSDSVFLVSYCDYGDVDVITGQRLKKLPDQFRELPELSIRARLTGVAPRSKEWEAEECLFFQQLTVDKKFVSRVERMRSIGINGDEAQIELRLVDVSSGEDVDIGALLVRKKLAIPAI